MADAEQVPQASISARRALRRSRTQQKVSSVPLPRLQRNWYGRGRERHFQRRNQGVGTEESSRMARDCEGCACRRRSTQVTVSAASAARSRAKSLLIESSRLPSAWQRRSIRSRLRRYDGVGVPSQVTEILGRAREALPGVRLRAHFHNTRNTGLANAYAASRRASRHSIPVLAVSVVSVCTCCNWQYSNEISSTCCSGWAYRRESI